MPFIFSPFQINLFHSMLEPSGWMPSREMLAPFRELSMMSFRQDGAPLISRHTSNPSVISSSFITSTSFSRVTFTVRSAPSVLARLRRKSLMSVITTVLAPAFLQTAAAMQPMTPAPVIRTSSPTMSQDKAVWTALPRGSKMEAISIGMLLWMRTTLSWGMERYSAKQPGLFTPTPFVFGQRCF